jgi:glycine hydroxymethyltransferase
MKKTIVFVCTGNICRSPMAEYYLKHSLGRKTKWDVISSGTGACFGLHASDYAVDVMKEVGIDISAHVSRPLNIDLVSTADLIIVMAQHHAEFIRHKFTQYREKVFLLKSFGPDGHGDVDDPMGGSREQYRHVREEIMSCMHGLHDFMNKLEFKS